MGSQRYIAETLTAHYDITLADAYQLVEKFEAAQLGDRIEDALSSLQLGDREKGFWELGDIVNKLGDALTDLMLALTPLEKKEKTDA